jgi:hypothetical protein
MQQLGVATWDHGFVRVPDGGRSLAQQPGPRDGMHVWLEGLTKSFLSYTLYMMVRVAKWCTKQQLKDAAAAFPWPIGEKSMSRPGYLPDSAFTGAAKRKDKGKAKKRKKTKCKPPRAPNAAVPAIQRPRRNTAQRAPHAEPAGYHQAPTPEIGQRQIPQHRIQSTALNRPKKSAHPPFTAHHMLIFTLLSLELFRPFVPPNARRNFAFWDVWVLQVFILQSLMKPSHTYSELLDLDIAIHRMFTRFEQVPEYKGFWVPKFHFAAHAAMDVLRFGPMRLNWCMMYEAKNQPLKKGCKRGNFHNTGKTTSKFWADSSDHEIRKRRKRNPVMKPGPVKKKGTSDQFPELTAELSAIQQASQLPPNATFQMLRSANKYNVHFFTATYAILGEMPGIAKQTIGLIQHMIMSNNNIYVAVDVFPPEVIHYDEMGVMGTTVRELKHSNTTYMLINLEKEPLTALWHFRRDGQLTFVAKW